MHCAECTTHVGAICVSMDKRNSSFLHVSGAKCGGLLVSHISPISSTEDSLWAIEPTSLTHHKQAG